ncbi:hypothetical protein [Photobacterium leiognathi]|uniref:hypothetical protein n=1 Tax=Photobacterium leiognathi TaxID=553611 RepID=UPI00273931B7|nr:hypothetical protein [Photobacterium leiognathi]
MSNPSRSHQLSNSENDNTIKIPADKLIEALFHVNQCEHNYATQESVDNLKESVNYRFDAVDKRFDALKGHVDKRFEDVDKRFSALEGHVDKRFEDVDKRFSALEGHVDKRFDALNQNLSNLKNLLIVFSGAIFTAVIGLILKGYIG